MAKGNPDNLDFNSHTSLMFFNKIRGANEDKWNKWEYDHQKKELAEDTLATLDDREDVKKHVEAFFDGKDAVFLVNLYGRNSGNRNSGNLNSGNRNSGNLNSGDLNSGDRNSGNLNSGYLNSGDLNSGNLNSGNLNSGNRNSGNRNSGNRNSGDRNSGNLNSGYLNSDTPTVRMFNKDTGLSFDDVNVPSCLWRLEVTRWVEFSAMTDEEKIAYPKAYVCDGYLRRFDYKDAWATLWATMNGAEKASVKALPNFDAKVFEEITGIKV